MNPAWGKLRSRLLWWGRGSASLEWPHEESAGSSSHCRGKHYYYYFSLYHPSKYFLFFLRDHGLTSVRWMLSGSGGLLMIPNFLLPLTPASEVHIYLLVLWAWQRRPRYRPIRVRHSATRPSQWGRGALRMNEITPIEFEFHPNFIGSNLFSDVMMCQQADVNWFTDWGGLCTK